MKLLFTLTSALILASIFTEATAQPEFNPTEKGNRQAGLQMMLAPTDMFWSETSLTINKSVKRYGLHLAPSYGWFIERNWMMGAQLNIGAYRDKYETTNAWGYDEKVFDVALTPMTRYYFTVDRKHRFKPFLFAGLPLVYHNVNRESGSNGPGTYKEETLELRGTVGFGAAYFGRAGSIELNLSNMGFFLGVSKFFPRKVKP